MKIAFYIDTMVRCGAQRVMANLINYYLEQNYDVVLINDFPLSDSIPQYVFPSNLIRHYLHEKNKKGFFLKNIQRVLRLRKVIKMEKPSIAISFLGRVNIRFLIATIKMPLKKIVSVRNDPRHEYGSSSIYKSLSNMLFRLADGIVFQTQEASLYFDKVLERKKAIIPNSVDPVFFDTPYIGGEGIVTFGRLEPQKKHSLLIDSFGEIASKYPNINLFIYGVGSLEKKLKEQIENSGLSKRVFLMGVTDDVRKELSKAMLFVLSSDYEGMPNALMESLAVGVPSISTDCPCGGPRDLIQNGVNGILVPCDDKRSMVNAIDNMLANNRLRQTISENARKTAKLFSPTIINEKWQSFFMKVLNSN